MNGFDWDQGEEPPEEEDQKKIKQNRDKEKQRRKKESQYEKEGQKKHSVHFLNLPEPEY